DRSGWQSPACLCDAQPHRRFLRHVASAEEAEMNGLATLAGDIPLRDYLLLALMLALLTAALGFTVKGAAARREERLERRLRLFREDPAAAGSSFPLLPIDFEKPESDTPKETAERPGGVRALSLLIRRQP